MNMIEWQQPNPETTAIYRGAIELAKHTRNATSAQASVRAWERDQTRLPDYEVEVVS